MLLGVQPQRPRYYTLRPPPPPRTPGHRTLCGIPRPAPGGIRYIRSAVSRQIVRAEFRNTDWSNLAYIYVLYSSRFVRGARRLQGSTHCGRRHACLCVQQPGAKIQGHQQTAEWIVRLAPSLTNSRCKPIASHVCEPQEAKPPRQTAPLAHLQAVWFALLCTYLGQGNTMRVEYPAM